MSEWTPERIENFITDVEDSIDRERSHEEPAEHLCTLFEEAFDILRAQQAELEAARDMVKILAPVLDKINLPTGVPGMETVNVQMDAAVIHGLRWALEQYDAARAGEEEQ